MRRKNASREGTSLLCSLVSLYHINLYCQGGWYFFAKKQKFWEERSLKDCARSPFMGKFVLEDHFFSRSSRFLSK